MARRSTLWVSLVTILALSISVAACQQAAAPSTSGQKVDYPTKPVTIMAGSAAGGGMDAMARALADILVKEKLVSVALPVQNAANHPEGVANLVQQHKGDAYLIFTGSLGTLLNYASGASPYGAKDMTPIANVYSAYYGFFVRDDSPYKTLGDLLKDLKEKPEQTPLTGGQADDRIAYGAVGMAYGVDIKKINYAAYSGGSQAAAALLEGTPKALITTVEDVQGLAEAKKIRALAVSTPQRMTGPLSYAPTLKEAGVNIEGWGNSRFMVGGPAMPDYAVKYWQDTLAKMMKTPTWAEYRTKYNWTESWVSDGIVEYVNNMQATVDKVSAELGLKK